MRTINFRYYLLDSTDTPKLTGTGDTNELYCVQSGDISYNSLGRLKGSLNVNIKLDDRLTIDYLTDRIKVVCEIDNVPYSMGIYLISTAVKQTKGNIQTRSLTCYSKLKLLENDKVDNSYYVAKGTNVVSKVESLLGDNPSNIAASTSTTSTDRTWEIGTSKIDIINNLLDTINYTSLVVDNEGIFTSKQYVEPSAREYNIKYEDDEILADYSEELDSYNVPNVFVKYISNEEETLIARYPIEGTMDDRLPNVDVQQLNDISDQTTLYNKCKRSAIDSRSIYEHFTFKTPINPTHGYMDCIYIHGSNYIETSWRFDLKVGGSMWHECRKVVDLDD